MNNLYLIIGEDEKIVNFNLYNILDKIDYVDDNKIIYDHSVDSLTSVIDEASMMSLNGLLKVIIFNNFDSTFSGVLSASSTQPYRCAFRNTCVSTPMFGAPHRTLQTTFAVFWPMPGNFISASRL